VTEGEAPLGVPEMLDAAGSAATVLDLGCGSGRLTVALAERGARVVGVDVNPRRLGEVEQRAAAARVWVQTVAADMDEPLPFPDGTFDAAVNRLSLMIARDPAVTLGELRRVLRAGGSTVTAVWAAADANPWFVEPRAAVAAALGADRAAFARVFGRLGDLRELERLHREAGFEDVHGRVLADELRPASAAEHWDHLTARIGHFRRLAGELTDAEAAAVAAELERRLAPHRRDGRLALPRTMLLVTARSRVGG
jgi:ubiquinone/menaquinone biosynthesis C-methylase UbiE